MDINAVETRSWININIVILFVPEIPNRGMIYLDKTVG